jgi:hypothetical protein
MAKLTFNIATDMLALQSYGGSPSLETSSELIIASGANENVYFGSGLAYGNGGLTGGTIFGYAQIANGVTTTTLTGINLPTSAVAQQLNASNLTNLLALTLTGGDTIIGSGANDTLVGYGAGDTFAGGAGNNTITGTGAGNTAVEDTGHLLASVTSTLTSISVTRPDGIDTLTGIQTVQFADGRLAFSTTDDAAKVERLYQAALGRAPDQQGLSYWTNALDNGASLTSLAQSFLGSAEFLSRYPAAASSNSAFVTQLYENVLGRQPDAGGDSYWVGQLSSGADSQAQVLTDFSESTENQSNTAFASASGIWVTDPVAAQIARLYDTAFSRLPDVAGLTSWKTAIEGGQDTLTQVADAFVSSAEFQAKYGALNNTNFVTALYNNALHRAPDSGGLASWVAALNGGEDRGAVVVAFSESSEHVSDTAANVYGSGTAYGIKFAS